jgi:hypothetical protein
MKRKPFWLLCGIAILGSVGYFGTYAYYRFINPDGVIDHFRVRGSGSFSALSIAESSCGDSIVSKLSDWTGTSISPTVNHLYFPLIQLDLLATGRSIWFTETFKTRRH